MLKILRQPLPLGRYWRLLAAGLLLAGLVAVAVIWIQYQTTKKPLQDLGALPWVPDVLTSEAPHYTQSFYGDAGVLAKPLGVVVDQDDRVFVSESGGDRVVRVFDPSGREIGAISPPDSVSHARTPVYMAISPDGRIFVADRPLDTIHIYNRDLSFAGEFEHRGVEQWQPMGLAFGSDGNLYVTNVAVGKHNVAVFDKDGNLKLEFGAQGTEPGQFWFPNGIAVDSRGRMYVADGNNGRVQVFDESGNLLSSIPRGYGPADLGMPRGVAIDGENRLFVVDTTGHDVKVFDVSGDKLRALSGFGAYGIGDGQFRFPNGVAVDSHSKVYITDREGGRLTVWSY